MFWPATTGSGASVFVTTRFGPGSTALVVAVAVLFPSSVSMLLDAVTLWLIVVLFGVLAITCTTSVIVTGFWLGTISLVLAVITPPVGPEVVQPAGARMDTKLVLAGTEVVTVTGPELLGPMFVTLMV